MAQPPKEGSTARGTCRTEYSYEQAKQDLLGIVDEHDYKAGLTVEEMRNIEEYVIDDVKEIKDCLAKGCIWKGAPSGLHWISKVFNGFHWISNP